MNFSVLLKPSGPWLALIAGLLLTQTAMGRVVNITVTVDGKKALFGDFVDTGTEPPEVVWRYLNQVALNPVKEVEIEAVEENPLFAVLEGNIEVEVAHAGKARVSQLKLERQQEDDPFWHLGAEQVESMARDLGLPELATPDPVKAPLPHHPVEQEFFWTWIILGAIALTAVILALLSFKRTGAKKSS